MSGHAEQITEGTRVHDRGIHEVIVHTKTLSKAFSYQADLVVDHFILRVAFLDKDQLVANRFSSQGSDKGAKNLMFSEGCVFGLKSNVPLGPIRASLGLFKCKGIKL